MRTCIVNINLFYKSVEANARIYYVNNATLMLLQKVRKATFCENIFTYSSIKK